MYSLNLVNDIFEKDVKECIHNYRIVHDKHSKKVIEGLCFTFIELPKFQPHTMKEKRMTVLWLRFLTEINDKTQEVPAELLENPDISKALEEVKISAFTDEELRAYDKFWDRVSSEKTLMDGRYDEGLKEGMEQGIEVGKQAGLAEKAIQIAKKMKAAGMDAETIHEMTGLEKKIIEFKL